MKLINQVKWFSATFGLALLFASEDVALAQAPGADKGPATMNAAMVRFFGSNTNFISKAEVRVLDKNQQETTFMVMGFDMLAGKLRVDINLAEVKSKEMSPELAAMTKSMGMDQMSTILLPDKKTVISIYPGLKSYAETPMSKEDIEAATMEYKIDKNRLAKETIEGHACDKDAVTLTNPKGEKERATIWYATDMKDFPIQMQIPADDATLVMKFKDVKLGRPELGRFEAPTGLTKYDDISTLMSDAVAKKMGVGTSK